MASSMGLFAIYTARGAKNKLNANFLEGDENIPVQWDTEQGWVKNFRESAPWMTHGLHVRVLLQELPVHLDSEECSYRSIPYG